MAMRSCFSSNGAPACKPAGQQAPRRPSSGKKALGGAVRTATVRRRLSFPAVCAPQSFRQPSFSGNLPACQARLNLPPSGSRQTKWQVFLLEILGELIKMKGLCPTERTCMKSIASRLPLILTGVVLLARSGPAWPPVGWNTAASPRPCGRGSDVGGRGEDAWPTLAPPQKVVFVRVEADKPDLEVGWAEN